MDNVAEELEGYIVSAEKNNRQFEVVSMAAWKYSQNNGLPRIKWFHGLKKISAIRVIRLIRDSDNFRLGG
jgi:hypothetical protein